MHGQRGVCSERPRRSRPDENVLVRAALNRKPQRDARVGDFTVRVCTNQLVLREAGAAADAPRHRAPALVKPALLVTPLQEVPNMLDIGIVHGVVRVVPVHPLAEPDGLLRLHAGEMLDALAALAGEVIEAEFFDFMLRIETEVAFDLHFQPKSLAIETVLVALHVTLHGFKALVDIFVGASPRVVNAHGIIGGNGAVNERPARIAAVLRDKLLEGIGILPELQDPMLHTGKVEVSIDFLKPGHLAPPRCRYSAAGNLLECYVAFGTL